MIIKPQDFKTFYGFIGEFVIININNLHSSLQSKLYFHLTMFRLGYIVIQC